MAQSSAANPEALIDIWPTATEEEPSPETDGTFNAAPTVLQQQIRRISADDEAVFRAAPPVATLAAVVGLNSSASPATAVRAVGPFAEEEGDGGGSFGPGESALRSRSQLSRLSFGDLMWGEGESDHDHNE